MVNNGGPAFPVELRASHAEGMSLRDWFAGQALAGLLAASDADHPTWAITDYAYRVADAMLAARQELKP